MKFQNKSTYQNYTLSECAKQLQERTKEVILDGSHLKLQEINSIARNSSTVRVTEDSNVLKRVMDCYEHMMDHVFRGIPMYGINTGYGGQANLVLNKGTKTQRLDQARRISESIVHVDVSTGPAVPKEITRAAMGIRANMLLKGVSAVKIADIDMFCQLLNHDIIPVVGSYGGLGASGDLPQNGRVLSLMRQLPGTKVWGKYGFEDGPTALKNHKFKTLVLDPKTGLGLVNGDNFSTASAFHLARETVFVLLTQVITGSMVIEALEGTNRSLHPMLSQVRAHSGQIEVSAILRRVLGGSKYVRDELQELLPHVEGRKVQDVYSLRCQAQFLGISWERVKWALDVIETNANGASDNPLWVTEEYALAGETAGQWVSGGNFLAEYMVEVTDTLRKILTHVVKINDRHLSKLIDPHENNGLPANLSHQDAISQCTFKGIQAQAGMFDVYSMVLATPVSTLFGVHEQNNQDVTSHAMTSGILGRENLQVTWYSLAQLLIALMQAIDLRDGPKKLSPVTKQVYEQIRKEVPFIKKEMPLGPYIELVAEKLKTDTFRTLLISLLD